jgi:hypothetical protein
MFALFVIRFFALRAKKRITDLKVGTLLLVDNRPAIARPGQVVNLKLGPPREASAYRGDIGRPGVGA